MNMSIKCYLYTYVVYHITCMLGDNKDIIIIIIIIIIKSGGFKPLHIPEEMEDGPLRIISFQLLQISELS